MMTNSSALHEKIFLRLREVGADYELHHLPAPLLESILDEAKHQVEAQLSKAEERAIRSVVTKKLVVRVIRDRLLSKEGSQ